ncbi:SMP-30/gluconolactonase/LRE family protein [Pseudooceanicola sp. 216_PA32_1]|uniref:SMP-30/gluconolactonase/LRE family protein n=1 Tax=Pseudooceanicola pacificus TaxID=2676438 RepID=A0A844W0F1_9RHOB|nr:SMP-30/gluconolactonase/LRE family protein [Pseudooceanicola pacificus]MWB77546.1 SMP-30/gluconolactonase/LRE family protein [Pseudooceanicola pacificus]
MEFETVCTGLEFPEGPIAMADGSVILVEIKGGRLTRVLPDGTRETVAELGGGPNGAAIGPDGAVYVCNNGGFIWSERDGLAMPGGQPEDYTGGSIQRVDLATGVVTTLYTEWEGRPLRGPNDIVFDAEGGFYFTDLGKHTPEFLHQGALYYALPDGSSITRPAVPLMTPNGVGMAPDGSEVYVAETRTSRLWGFAVTGQGQLARPSGFRPGRLVTTLPDYQLLDSLAVQENGAVCLATLMRGGISIVAHDTGAVEYIQFPGDPYITNICFGGADMRDAWITASGTGTLYKVRWPYPGLRLNFNG